MHERLIESWLDNANELSYQAPFCQMLIGQGYRIVHSTRHAPIELGKDVIAIDPDGTVCAYQLKAHPGGRLTLRAFRDVMPQAEELVSLNIPDWGPAGRWHRSYLVTNGEIDEEVRLAVERFNQGFERLGTPEKRLELIGRGELLAMARELGAALWPSELRQVRTLIELLVANGTGELDLAKLEEMLRVVLAVPDDSAPVGRAELRRRATSAALLTGTALGPFALSQNQFGVAAGWIVLAAQVCGAVERHGHDDGLVADTVTLALDTAWDQLAALAIEACRRGLPTQGPPFTDVLTFRPRATLLLGLFGALWFRCCEAGWPVDLDREVLLVFQEENLKHALLWGEGAIPQMLSLVWFLRRVNATSIPEDYLASMLTGIARQGDAAGPPALANPYYSVDDVLRHIAADFLGHSHDPLRRERLGHSSFFGEPLLHLLVRTGRKRACKAIWPDLSTKDHVEFVPDKPWEYVRWRTESGRYVTKHHHPTKHWGELVAAARDSSASEIPNAMRQDPLFLLLFIILYPHRATPNVVRFLGRRLDPVWFLPED